MINNTDAFVKKVRAELKRRKLSQVRLALDINENPVALAHMFSGFRPTRRLREKVSRYLNIPLESRP